MTVTERPAGTVRAIGRRSASDLGMERLDLELGSNDDVVIAVMTGDLTGITIKVVSTLVDDLVASGQYQLMLDCRRLYTIDADGLTGLHEAREVLEENDGSLTMTGVRPQVRAALVRAGSAEHFGVPEEPER
jgi:anti-anti-sigma regulatory factor